MVHLECGEQISAGAALRELSAAADLADVSGVFGRAALRAISAPGHDSTPQLERGVGGTRALPRDHRAHREQVVLPTLAPPSSAAAASPDFLQATLAPPTIVSEDSVSSAYGRPHARRQRATGRAGSSTASPRRPRVLPHMVTSLCWVTVGTVPRRAQQ